MYQLAVTIVLASVAQAHAELQMTPTHYTDLDNVTLNVIMSRLSPYPQGPRSVLRAPQQSRNVPTYQQRAPLMQRDTFSSAAEPDKALPSASSAAAAEAAEWISNWKAKQGGGSATPPYVAKDSPELWETNVFNEAIQECPENALGLEGTATCTYKANA